MGRKGNSFSFLKKKRERSVVVHTYNTTRLVRLCNNSKLYVLMYIHTPYYNQPIGIKGWGGHTVFINSTILLYITILDFYFGQMDIYIYIL